MDTDNNLRFSAGAPPGGTDGTWQMPTAPPSPPVRRGITPGAVVAIATAVLVAGIGGGYLAFHKDAAAAPKDPKVALQDWSNGGGKTLMSGFSTDIDQLTTAANSQDSTGVHAACTSLQATVESAQAYRPMPDAQAQTSWAAALAAYARGAADCIAGTDRLDASLIDQFNTELGVGSGDLEQAATRLREINGS